MKIQLGNGVSESVAVLEKKECCELRYLLNRKLLRNKKQLREFISDYKLLFKSHFDWLQEIFDNKSIDESELLDSFDSLLLEYYTVDKTNQFSSSVSERDYLILMICYVDSQFDSLRSIKEKLIKKVKEQK